jgi:hypothetical protein
MKILMTLTNIPTFNNACISFGRDTQSPQEIIQILHSEIEQTEEFQMCSEKNTRLYNCYKTIARRLTMPKTTCWF